MKNELLNSAREAVKNWWVSLVIGILFVALGVWCMFTPISTFVALTILFIVSFLVGGILEIVFAVTNRKTMTGWGFTLTGGIIDILLGVLLMAFPVPITAQILIFFVGFWIMFRCIWSIGVAIDLQRVGVKGWGWMLAFAILGILLAIILIISPAFAAGFIVYFTAFAFMVYGIFRIYLAIKLRTMRKDMNKVEDFIEKVEDAIS